MKHRSAIMIALVLLTLIAASSGYVALTWRADRAAATEAMVKATEAAERTSRIAELEAEISLAMSAIERIKQDADEVRSKIAGLKIDAESLARSRLTPGQWRAISQTEKDRRVKAEKDARQKEIDALSAEISHHEAQKRDEETGLRSLNVELSRLKSR
jgi:chromosome segregation ATPase